MTFVESVNFVGLLLNFLGGLLLFKWGPPQPSFEENGFLCLRSRQRRWPRVG
jgi:hypothetical protein